MDKIKTISDRADITDVLNGDISDKKHYGDTRIRIYEETKGAYTLLSEGENKIVVSGSAFLMQKVVNMDVGIEMDSYNSILGLDANNPISITNGLDKGEQVILFAVGDIGCGPTIDDVFPVNYVSRLEKEKLIPFRIIEKDKGDLSDQDREKYFGKKTTSDAFTYYFKGFDELPTLRQEFTDGTPIDRNVYKSARKDEVNSYIRYKFTISNKDLVEYFNKMNINNRRISTVSLLTAVKSKHREDDGTERTFYQNIRPLTLYNFSKIDIPKTDDTTIIFVYDQYY